MRMSDFTIAVRSLFDSALVRCLCAGSAAYILLAAALLWACLRNAPEMPEAAE